jgi:hypothetical protein
MWVLDQDEYAQAGLEYTLITQYRSQPPSLLVEGQAATP